MFRDIVKTFLRQPVDDNFGPLRQPPQPGELKLYPNGVQSAKAIDQLPDRRAQA